MQSEQYLIPNNTCCYSYDVFASSVDQVFRGWFCCCWCRWWWRNSEQFLFWKMSRVWEVLPLRLIKNKNCRFLCTRDVPRERVSSWRPRPSVKVTAIRDLKFTGKRTLRHPELAYAKVTYFTHTKLPYVLSLFTVYLLFKRHLFSLIKGITTTNSHVVFSPNKQRSFEPFMCLVLSLINSFNWSWGVWHALIYIYIYMTESQGHFSQTPTGSQTHLSHP